MRNKGEKGIALLAVMVVVAILAGLTAALIAGASRRSAETDDLGASYEAVSAAQSVAEIALADLMAQGTGRIGAAGWDPDASDLNSSGYPDPGEPGVNPLRLGNAGIYAWSSDPVDLGGGKSRHTLYAGGTVDVPGHSPATVVLRVRVDVTPPGPPGTKAFSNAITSGSDDTPVRAAGSAMTDSYDSRDGVYGGANRGENGDVASNCGAALDGNARFNGDVTARGGYGVQLGGGSSVTGDASVVEAADVNDPDRIGGNIIPGAAKEELPAVADRGAQFAADNDNDDIEKTSLSLAGNETYTLPSGKYYFDEFKVAANAQLTIEAPCEIYVKGGCSVSGNGGIWVTGADQNNRVEVLAASGCQIAGNGIVGKDGISRPSDFVILSHGTAEMKVTGNGNLYASVYAPNAPVKIAGDGDIYGSFVGDSVAITGNGKVHYDEALAELVLENLSVAVVPGTPCDVSVLVWSRAR